MRELARIYDAWRRADPAGSERIATAPRLFLQAEAATREIPPGEPTPEGMCPESCWAQFARYPPAARERGPAVSCG